MSVGWASARTAPWPKASTSEGVNGPRSRRAATLSLRFAPLSAAKLPLVVTVNAPVNDRSVAGPLRERRLAAGVSQRRLAALAECSETMIRQLEGGYTPSYSDVLGRIARALDALDALDDEDPAATPGLVTTSAGQGGHGRP